MEIKRFILKDILAHLPQKEISLITGARQTGKTTLLYEIMNQLKAKGKNFMFLSLDNENDAKHFTSQENFLKKTSLELGNSGYIFIDEIQRKQDAGIFLKGLFDQKLPFKLIVTGSGSMELKEKIHESLAGRKRIFEMTPVSFKEFIDYKTFYKYEGKTSLFLETEPEKQLSYLNEYLNFGGYPRIVTEQLASEKLKLMDEIFKSYIEKDIVYLLKIERPDVFSLLIQIISNQTGMIVNYSSLASQVNVSTETLKKYLWYAEKTFCIEKITPYYTNFSKEITKSPTYYFTDIGFRNHSIGLMGHLIHNNQLGFIFQNMVYHELKTFIAWKGWTINFWRTTDKAEVDFIINKKSELLPVEVKYGKIEKLAVSRSFRSFIEKYHPKEAWVVTTGFENKTVINDTKIKFLPYFKVNS